MSKTDKSKADLPVEALMLEAVKDRYKIPYAALRWAKEIKQKENLPDSIPLLVQRAMRDVLTGKMSVKEIEKLPMITKAPTPPAAPAAPTITLNAEAIAEDEPVKKSKGKEKKED